MALVGLALLGDRYERRNFGRDQAFLFRLLDRDGLLAAVAPGVEDGTARVLAPVCRCSAIEEARRDRQREDTTHSPTAGEDGDARNGRMGGVDDTPDREGADEANRLPDRVDDGDATGNRRTGEDGSRQQPELRQDHEHARARQREHDLG